MRLAVVEVAARAVASEMPRRRGCLGLPRGFGLQDEPVCWQTERPFFRDRDTPRDEIDVAVGRERRPLGDEGLLPEDGPLVFLATGGGEWVAGSG